MKRAPAPRDLADLPFVRHLEPGGPIEISGEYDCAHFAGAELDRIDGTGAHFTECAFSAVSVHGGNFQKTRFSDVWTHGCQWTGADLADSSWLDAELVLDALSGVQAPGANMRRVRFYGCKFDSVNLRGAVLRDVSFTDCVLRHVDIAGATLNSVGFPGTRIEALALRKAQLKDVDFTGASELSVFDGIESLSGAAITQVQLIGLAPVFAHTLGITVR